MLTLTQSIGIIMGANVGTTFSAQLIAFGMGALRLDTLAAGLIFVGASMYVFTRRTRFKNIGYVLLGFGIMFFGVTYMSDAMRPLRADESFQAFLIGFENPVLALLAGFAITAVIQSSTATTAILVSLLASGVAIPFQTVAFILLGVNIGTSITTVVASIPASRESKRAALFHIMYDIIGSVTFGTLILVFPGVLNWFTSTWPENTAQQAAMFHTMYNVSTLLILMPFIKQISLLMQKIIPITQTRADAVYEKKLVYLDAQITSSSAVATHNAHMEICRMGKIANENLVLATEALFEKDAKKIKRTLENEKVVDYLNLRITSRLAEMNRMKLSAQEANRVSNMLIILSDIERIGDHAENIAEYAEVMLSEGLSFSPRAQEELQTLSQAVNNFTAQTLDIYQNQISNRAKEVNDAEQEVDDLTAKYEKNHIERLKNEQCVPEVGVIFTAITNDLERCADHALNIALSVPASKETDKKTAVRSSKKYSKKPGR